MTYESLLAAFGGIEQVMGITHAKRNAVNNWRAAGIPFRHWPALIQAAIERGIPDVNFETLHETRQPRAA